MEVTINGNKKMPNLQTLNSVEINYNWTRNQFYQNFLCRQWKLIFLALFEPLNELPLTKSNNYFYLLAYLLRPNKFNGTGTRNAATIILRGNELQKFEETVKNDPDLSEFDLFAFEVTSASDEDTQFNIEFCAGDYCSVSSRGFLVAVIAGPCAGTNTIKLFLL